MMIARYDFVMKVFFIRAGICGLCISLLTMLFSFSLDNSPSKVGLVCYQRADVESVPGCTGPGVPATDYCCDRPADYLFSVTNNPAPGTLNACEGDCDSDVDCSEGLVCELRNGFATVPGCDGMGRSGSDYCRYPEGDRALASAPN